MRSAVFEKISGLERAERQAGRGFILIPLVVTRAPDLDYLAAGDAIKKGFLRCREARSGARVPEIEVENTADQPVLILSGEELKGALQNRVANTSILVPERRELAIPVSCTEHGRWSYRPYRREPRRWPPGRPREASVLDELLDLEERTAPAMAFEDSGVLMSMVARYAKSRSVAASLRASGRYASDQGRVWDEVAQLHRKLGTHSATGAMRDGFTSRAGELSDWFGSFPRVTDQCGLIAARGGRILGLEHVSRPDVYARVHERLVTSYLVEYLHEDPPVEDAVSDNGIVEFIASLDGLAEESYPSVGYGDDLRYVGAGTSGSALVHHDHLVHAVIFVQQPDEFERLRRRPSHENQTRRRPDPSVAPGSANLRRAAQPAEPSPSAPRADDAAHREERRRRLDAHRKWQEAFLKLPPHLQLELIAWDTQRPLSFYPPQAAEAGHDALAAMDPHARAALMAKAEGLREGPWKDLLRD